MIPLGTLQQVVSMPAPPVEQNTLLNGLASWWNLDDDTTGDRTDQHGLNTLSAANNVSYDATENAADFENSSNQYLYANNPKGVVTGACDWSFAVRIKFESINNVPVVFMAGDGGVNASNCTVLAYINNSKFEIVYGFGGSWTVAVAASPVVAIDTWYDIVVTHDSINKQYTMVIDDGTPTVTTYTGTPNKKDTYFTLGKYHNTQPARVMDGMMKNAAWWARELTAEEITAYSTIDAYADLGAYTFQPSDIADCVVWLDATNPGETTNQWDDLSGADNHYTSPDAGTFPVIANDEARFNSDYVQGVDLSALTEGEAFFLYKVDSESGADAVKGGCSFGTASLNDHWPWGGDGQIYSAFGSTARKTCGNPTPPLTDYTVLNFHSAANDWGLKVNGTSLYSTVSNTVSFTSNTIIGKSAGSYYVIGYFKMIVIFSRKLTASERGTVLTHLLNLD